MRGVDEAGNVRYAGPYNVFVDPASDAPVAHVSHPAPGSRVSTVLHVVGTCVDDDGVKSVQVQLDDRDPATAEGTEFWAWEMSAEGLTEGVHTVTVHGVDINGLEGPAQTIRFNVDKKAPTTRISSHASGAIVSGKVALEGEVADPNGVVSLSASSDGGKVFEPLKLNLDKPGQKGTFRYDLDTKNLSDGALILSFKAVDRTGSTGRTAFLLFVNNQAPGLEVVFPTGDAIVNGKVTVIGRATDRIGVKSLGWELGGAAGTVALVAGNQFWTHQIDLSAQKAGTVQVTYTLENLTGNRQTSRLRLKVDPEADRPVLTVSSPAKGARLTGTVFVTGLAHDDDGVDRVEYSVDGAAPQTVATAAGFSIALPDLAPGAHKIVLKPVDVNGVVGLPVETAFTKAGPAPVIRLDTLTQTAGAATFGPGAVFSADKDGRLSGTIAFTGGTLQADYTLGGGATKALSLKKGATDTERLFDIVLPKALSSGRVDVAIKATDGFGGATEFRTFLFAGAEPASLGIVLVDGRLGSDGNLKLVDGPLAGYVTGGAIQKAELDPPSALLSLAVEGQVFRVSAAGSGATSPTRIRVTAADGSLVASDPITFSTDATPPALSLDAPVVGAWQKTELRLVGAATDAGGISAVEYAIDGGAFAPIQTRADGTGRHFAVLIPLVAQEEGPHLLAVRASDAAGNQAVTEVPFHKDVTAPVLSILSPRPQDEVNGLVTIVGRADDAGAIALVEASEDGKTLREVGHGPLFSFDVNLSKIAAGALLVRCADAAGNPAEVKPQLTVNTESDIPVAQIQVPADGELLRDDFVLSGMVFDDDGVQAVWYRIDNAEFQRLGGGNNFSVPLSIADLSDNEHVVEVKAEDLGGVMSVVAKARFKVSRSDPVSSLGYPRISDHLRDIVDLKGTSKDPNGIAEVRISFDNGLSFNRVQGTDTWQYQLDTRLLADGTQAVLVRAVDATGAEGLYTTTINIDNHAPELVVDSPGDGEVFADTLHLDGSTRDSIGVSSLAVSITPMVGTAAGAKPVEVALTRAGILAQDVDIKGLAAGWYNVQIEAADRAGNKSYVSRNFVKRPGEAERVQILYPATGERIAGPFMVSGRVLTQSPTDGKNVIVLAGGQPIDTTVLDAEGYFDLLVKPQDLKAGDITLAVEATIAGGVRLVSEARTVQFVKFGPWVKIDSFAAGDYVTGRPYLSGTAGWLADESAEPTVDAKGRAVKPDPGRAVSLVEISMDNGASFLEADGREAWRYRLESEQIPNGPLRLLVKATFAGGEVAVTRVQLTVDTRAPQVTLREPQEGGRFNESVQLMGTAYDESGLKEVTVSLRQGDKSRYQVPSFIQGLYLDAHTMGATWWDVGLGLTFFEDNIKLQMQLGMAPTGRFTGLVLGAKLLANLATVPFSYFFGPSWDFFSMSLAVGANFSYFTMSQDRIEFTDEGLVLGAVVAQLEFAKFTIEPWRALNTWALYTEYQLWFISSDVEGGTVSKLSFGLRIGLL
ncbi:MAG: Ig-like domain-containing protein [Spirochaetes bacterium]|nr:Ig-like domain-containing protein [Spirochaetota bacterium]